MSISGYQPPKRYIWLAKSALRLFMFYSQNKNKVETSIRIFFLDAHGGLSDKNYDHIKNLDSFHFVVR